MDQGDLRWAGGRGVTALAEEASSCRRLARYGRPSTTGPPLHHTPTSATGRPLSTPSAPPPPRCRSSPAALASGQSPPPRLLLLRASSRRSTTTSRRRPKKSTTLRVVKCICMWLNFVGQRLKAGRSFVHLLR